MARGTYRVTDPLIATLTKKWRHVEGRFLLGEINPKVVLDSIQELGTLGNPFLSSLLHDGKWDDCWPAGNGVMVRIGSNFIYTEGMGITTIFSGAPKQFPRGMREGYILSDRGVIIPSERQIAWCTTDGHIFMEWPDSLGELLHVWPDPRGVVALFSKGIRRIMADDHQDLLSTHTALDPANIRVQDGTIVVKSGSAYYIIKGGKSCRLNTPSCIRRSWVYPLGLIVQDDNDRLYLCTPDSNRQIWEGTTHAFGADESADILFYHSYNPSGIYVYDEAIGIQFVPFDDSEVQLILGVGTHGKVVSVSQGPTHNLVVQTDRKELWHCPPGLDPYLLFDGTDKYEFIGHQLGALLVRQVGITLVQPKNR
ncbi:hypothetical protein KKG41_04775 [Patescibacteria group bacterium]|nr:hypothetical protein [Patescibacteria group bacterium]MBU1890808.1 hypothetical protein [Patescibacteria group bacterium]